jgi:hypothetical protein
MLIGFFLATKVICHLASDGKGEREREGGGFLVTYPKVFFTTYSVSLADGSIDWGNKTRDQPD